MVRERADMRTTLRAIATRTGSLGDARSAVPRLAGALLALAGALLAVTLPLAAWRGGMPLGPLVMWLSWMALFVAAAVAVMAVLRVRRLETALRRERRRFRALAEAVPAGVCQFGPSGDLLFSNKACESLFGGAPQTCSKGPAFRGLPPEDRARLRDLWEAARNRRTPFAEEFRLVADGAERWVSLKAVPVAEGGQQGYVCCLAERSSRPHHAALRPTVAYPSRMA